MKALLLFLICLASLPAQSQVGQGLADISGRWTGHYFQKNYIDPSAPDMAYRAVMEVSQNENGEVEGTCTIYWYDDSQYYGRWAFNGNVNGQEFTYTEYSLTDNNPKPGFDWCLKDVVSNIVYNPETGSWMLKGGFKAHTQFYECSPGTMVFQKEKDI